METGAERTEERRLVEMKTRVEITRVKCMIGYLKDASGEIEKIAR